MLKEHPIDHDRNMLSLHTEYHFLLRKECEKVVQKRKYVLQLIRIIGKLMVLYKKHIQTTCTNTDLCQRNP